MRLGLCLPQIGRFASGRVIRQFAAVADGIGVDSLWAQEHLLQADAPEPAQPGWPGGMGYRSVLAPTEVLAYAVAATTRARLGTSVLVSAYHQPVELAQRMATLDVLSGGRVILGIGLGASEGGYRASGTPWEERGARCRDFIRAVRTCWGPNPVHYDGEFFTVPLCATSPDPVQAGGPPILGGFASAPGVRRSAELCDLWGPIGLEPADAVAGLEAVNRIATGLGRPPLELVLRVFASPWLPGRVEPSPPLLQPCWVGHADDFAIRVGDAAAAGVDELILDTGFSDVRSEDDWLDQPEFFEPAIDAAHHG